MDTKNEAPISVSSTVYYRGVAIIITKRSPDVSIEPLLEQQMKVIDWMLDTKNAKPSWNEQTNKEAAGIQIGGGGGGMDMSSPTPVQATGSNVGGCPTCGSPLIEGITKNGKKYTKCSTNKWDRNQQKSVGCPYIKWAQMTQADL